jgi:hypothetical protein
LERQRDEACEPNPPGDAHLAGDTEVFGLWEYLGGTTVLHKERATELVLVFLIIPITYRPELPPEARRAFDCNKLGIFLLAYTKLPMNKDVLRRCSLIAFGSWLLLVPHLATADTFVFDPTTSSRLDIPVWMGDRPVAVAKDRAELSFPVTPGTDDNDMALTVVFNEESGAYLSVFWQPEQGDRELLCDNLIENIGLPNQRTLLINRPTMGGPGRIILQSSTQFLNVIRVRIDWVRPGVVRLVDSAPNGALVMNGAKIFAPEEVDGSRLTAVADSWEGKILTTSITDSAERIEKGVAFPVTVPAHLRRARMEVMVNGLPLNGLLKVWLNGQVVGTLSFEVPDLTDPGYGEENNDQFVGWRRGVLFLPPSRLVVGDNQFQFEGPAGTPIAIRDFLLQVQYASD